MSEATIDRKAENAARKAQKAAARQEKRERSWLNRCFHHVDRGSTTAREIMGGLLSCILCVCAVFMNMQLICSLLLSSPAGGASMEQIAQNGEIIARQYFLSMLLAFAGSLAMGLIAGLPLVQIPSLGLSSLMISALSVTPLNAAARRDGARSGLSAVVASLGFLASAFVWVVPFLFSTTSSYEIQFNLYGHYGTSMQLFAESGFIVADGVMAIAGLCLIAGALKDGLGDTKAAAPFLATVAGAFFLNSLALGAAIGIVAHALTNLLDRQRSLTLGNLCAAAVSAGSIVLALLL